MKKILLIGYIVLLAACQNSPSTPVFETAPIVVTSTSHPTATTTRFATFTPAPVFTPTPVPRFFADEFSAITGSWVSFQTSGVESPAVKLENDFLRIDFSTPDTWYYAIHNAHEYSSVFVSAKFSGTPTGSLGVICDYDELKGWYEFNLASDGIYSILFGQWLADGIAVYTPIIVDDSEYLKEGNLSYEIGLTCQDNTLLPYINGKLFTKVDVARYGLTEGKIGISASSFDEVPMIASFDWVKVEEPGQ